MSAVKNSRILNQFLMYWKPVKTAQHRRSTVSLFGASKAAFLWIIRCRWDSKGLITNEGDTLVK